MKQTRYKPGEVGRREFQNYNEYQDALWKVFDDFYYADVGGYSAMRMPTPGKQVVPSEAYQLNFEDWKNLVVSRWTSEAKRDKNTRGCEITEFSDNFWYYLYERFLNVVDEHYVGRWKPVPVKSTNPDPDPELDSLGSTVNSNFSPPRNI